MTGDLRELGANDLVTLFCDSYRPASAPRPSTNRYGLSDTGRRALDYHFPRQYLAGNRESLLQILEAKLIELRDRRQHQSLEELRSRISREQSEAARSQLQRVFDDAVGAFMRASAQGLRSVIDHLVNKQQRFIQGALVSRYNTVQGMNRYGVIPQSATSALEQMGTGARMYLETMLTLAAAGRVPSYPGRAGDYREMAINDARGTWNTLPPDHVTLLDQHWSELRDALTDHARSALVAAFRTLGQHRITIPSSRGTIVVTVEQQVQNLIPGMSHRPGRRAVSP